MTAEVTLETVIAKVGDLPAMPAVVSEVLRKTEDPAVDLGEVCRIIESDPALAAKILQVSNSSYYGMKQYVSTLKLALVILGVREVRNIVLGVSVFETLKGGAHDAKVAHNIWNNSLQIAGIAKKLSTHLALGMQGEEFIAGLLADTGKMLMLHLLGKPYEDLLHSRGGDAMALLDAEMEVFDYTHADAATALARKWSLPEGLMHALWCQYPLPERRLAETAEPLLAAVVRLARAASDDDFSAPEGQRSVADDEAWITLARARNPVRAEDRLALLAQIQKETAEAAVLPL
jgi:HD-like signal output (HDOD) protein